MAPEDLGEHPKDVVKEYGAIAKMRCPCGGSHRLMSQALAVDLRDGKHFDLIEL